MTYTVHTSNIIGPTYTVTAAGGSGGVYGMGGSGGSATVLTSGSSTWATLSADPSLKGSTLKVDGNANISGELTVQGVKLSDRLDKIEERLGILRPNESLEEKWENLRALGNAYRELEKEILEKQEMWAILKK